MGFQVEHFVDTCVAAGWQGLLQQLVSRLHGVRPIRQSNVEPEAREDGVGLYYISSKSLARAIDPDDGVLRTPGFTVTVDDIQVSGVDAFAAGILDRKSVV